MVFLCQTCEEMLLSGGGPPQMSGRWLLPAAGYYGLPTGKNGVAKMASLRLRIGAQITRKYAHNLLPDLYILNFYGKQHKNMFLIYNSIGLGLVEAQVASEIVREVGRKIVS